MIFPFWMNNGFTKTEIGYIWMFVSQIGGSKAMGFDTTKA
jgi:hypothetical protein